MKRPLPLPEQILANFADVERSPHFPGDELWLTFYLWGEPANLERLAIALQHEGWVNTGGSEGAFLYPKVAVRKTAADIIKKAESTKKLCDAHQVGIILIDADVSPEVGGEQRPFVTLYRGPP